VVLRRIPSRHSISPMFRTIDNITLRPNHQLLLHYAGGEDVLVEFRSVIEHGGVFARLAEPHFFAQVRVGERGRYIEWPGDLDFCADTLWEEGQHSFPHRDARVECSNASQPAEQVHSE
jgi:Protein of unknown function (DUF2442)